MYYLSIFRLSQMSAKPRLLLQNPPAQDHKTARWNFARIFASLTHVCVFYARVSHVLTCGSFKLCSYIMPRLVKSALSKGLAEEKVLADDYEGLFLI